MTLHLEIKRQEILALALIILITLIVRLHFLSLVQDDPAFRMPVVDSLEYDIWAYKIYHDNWFWDKTPYHLPLYPYFVAGIYRIFGYNLYSVAVIQYSIACLSSLFLYLIARRLAGSGVALVASILMAVYWFFIYTQTFLFSENLSLFFNTLLIYLLFSRRESFLKYLNCGIILGLSVASRPDILTFAGIIFLWLWWKNKSLLAALRHYTPFILGVILVLLPIVARNIMISHEPIFLRSQVGVNMYIGNNPVYKGAAAVEIGKDWDELISLPEQTYQREVSESESDRFFLKETIETIKHQPRAWTKLMAGKIYSILTGRDFLRSEDVYFYDHYFTRTPYYLISTRLIFILFIVGLFISWRRSKDFALLYLFLASELFIIFFQIKTRYLIPVFPIVIIFSALTLHELFVRFKARELHLALALIAGVMLINALTLYNPLGIEPPTTAETHYAIGRNYLERSLLDPAIDELQRALAINPRHIAAYNTLGLIYRHRAEEAAACEFFAKALALDPAAHIVKLNYALCR